MSHAGLSNKKNEDASYDVEAAALSGGSAAFRPLAGVCVCGGVYGDVFVGMFIGVSLVFSSMFLLVFAYVRFS